MIITDIQIRFSDVDRLQHVNNVVLQQYYDIGKVQYFKSVLSEEHLWCDEAFIVVNTNTNYFEELFEADKFHITTKIIRLGTKSVTLHQEIVDLTTQRIKGSSDSILVNFDLKQRVGIEISTKKREDIVAHEGAHIEAQE